MSKGGNMADSIEKAMERISRVRDFPQSMVVVAGSRGCGTTRFAQLLAAKGFGTYINLSLQLARYRMTVDASDDVGWPTDCMARLLSSMAPGSPLILDHIEGIFEPELELNPLSWFLQWAREVPLVVVWPGVVSQGDFIYSRADRSDYFRQRDSAVVVVHIEA